ncbi:hypothetical protein [Sulfurimonas sp. C5]|uniref:hypothetical protein n=1 Tax=Sulfurimonas sp. C5 TaxID=3036947 RepID=UPI00245398A6|nr:hypothetical protein [Sulfurimonas sp. C5]MDH4945302.1 hypothetical protein [Sulfurimonas sp. C5]
MGKIEDQIKVDLLQNIYADSVAIYEFIESRFALGEEERQKIIERINAMNDGLVLVLKNVKLS